MPCHFSGIFYITELENNKMVCSANDENGNLQQVDIGYYYPSNMDRPFPEAYEFVEPGHVYFITGYFALENKEPIVFPFIFYQN
jgi:hypothetical protein